MLGWYFLFEPIKSTHSGSGRFYRLKQKVPAEHLPLTWPGVRSSMILNSPNHRPLRSASTDSWRVNAG